MNEQSPNKGKLGFEDIASRTLNGYYDSSPGNNPRQREETRNLIKDIRDLANSPKSRFYTLTKEDFLVLAVYAARLSERAAEFSIIRERQTDSERKRGHLG